MNPRNWVSSPRSIWWSQLLGMPETYRAQDDPCGYLRYLLGSTRLVAYLLNPVGINVVSVWAFHLRWLGINGNPGTSP